VKQFQNRQELPRSGQKTERYAFRCPPAIKRKVMRKGGAAWLCKLIREAS
jgi:hypothetical protein